MNSAADKIKGRQLEILRRLSHGEKQSAIAADLGIAIGTLDCYRNRLYRRLGARNAAQALANYLRSRQPELPLL